MFSEELGDRCKDYERASDSRLMPLLPAMARIDGRAFSSFTRHAKKPFSETFLNVMDALTLFLVKETGATVGYTQSDEVTLCWYSSDRKSEYFFDGRVQKMASQLGALASAWLNTEGRKIGPMTTDTTNVSSGLKWAQLPTFDARVWNVPTLEEAANVFLWRQSDAVRNSVQMQVRHYFSHTQCLNKSVEEMKTMLREYAERVHVAQRAYGSSVYTTAPVLWEGLSDRIKRGVFVRKTKSERKFTAAEIDKLPALHQARKDPNLVVVRSDYSMQPLWLSKVRNRVGVLFLGEEPKMSELSFDMPDGSKKTTQEIVDDLNAQHGPDTAYTLYEGVIATKKL